MIEPNTPAELVPRSMANLPPDSRLSLNAEERAACRNEVDRELRGFLRGLVFAKGNLGDCEAVVPPPAILLIDRLRRKPVSEHTRGERAYVAAIELFRKYPEHGMALSLGLRDGAVQLQREGKSR